METFLKYFWTSTKKSTHTSGTEYRGTAGIEALPNELILKIFDQLQPFEQYIFGLVSRRFWRLLHARGKPARQSVCLMLTGREDIPGEDKVKIVCTDNQGLYSREVRNVEYSKSAWRDVMCAHFATIDVSHQLFITRVNIDSRLASGLRIAVSRKVDDLRLKELRVHLTPDEFYEFMSGILVGFGSISRCKFKGFSYTSFPITDELFRACFPNWRRIEVDSRGWDLPHLTDATLALWITDPPIRIRLRYCISRFTLAGLLHFIRRAPAQCVLGYICLENVAKHLPSDVIFDEDEDAATVNSPTPERRIPTPERRIVSAYRCIGISEAFACLNLCNFRLANKRFAVLDICCAAAAFRRPCDHATRPEHDRRRAMNTWRTNRFWHIDHPNVIYFDEPEPEEGSPSLDALPCLIIARIAKFLQLEGHNSFSLKLTCRRLWNVLQYQADLKKGITHYAFTTKKRTC